MEYSFLIYKLVLILFIFTVTLLIALYSTFAERKVAAFMQDRLGPDRAGPGGILQPLADGIKMFTKEEINIGLTFGIRKSGTGKRLVQMKT